MVVYQPQCTGNIDPNAPSAKMCDDHVECESKISLRRGTDSQLGRIILYTVRDGC